MNNQQEYIPLEIIRNIIDQSDNIFPNEQEEFDNIFPLSALENNLKE